MESATNKRKWITLLLTAAMSIALLFGATACNSNTVNDGTDGIVPDSGASMENPSPSESASASASE